MGGRGRRVRIGFEAQPGSPEDFTKLLTSEMKVWIPIVPKYTFADTSAWVEKLSRAVGALVPDLAAIRVS